LDSPGKVSYQQAINHAETQYQMFERDRRELAEQEAEVKYLEDLKSSVKLVAAKKEK